MSITLSGSVSKSRQRVVTESRSCGQTILVVEFAGTLPLIRFSVNACSWPPEKIGHTSRFYLDCCSLNERSLLGRELGKVRNSLSSVWLKN